MNKLIIMVGFLFSAQSFSASFKEGSRFEQVRFEGVANIICRENGQTDRAYYQCSDDTLSPSVYGSFQHDSGVDADRVNLTAIREDGSTRSKDKAFRNGESRRRFNLWLASLFQRPLLKKGSNSIQWELTKNGQVVESGEFDVEVVPNARTLQCDRRLLTSNNLSDCRGYASACSYYFRRTSCR